MRTSVKKALEWKTCSEPDVGELVELTSWFDSNGLIYINYIVYADFFEPRVFYLETRDKFRQYEPKSRWERAEMDRPNL